MNNVSLSLLVAGVISVVLVGALGHVGAATTDQTSAVSEADVFVSDRAIRITNESPELTHNTLEIDRLSAQLAAVSKRLNRIEQQLKKTAVQGVSRQKIESPPPPTATTTTSHPRYQHDASELESQWVSQTADNNWAAQVDTELSAMQANVSSLGLGEIDMDSADCRGELCKLHLRSAIKPAMLQHLLARFAGTTRIVADPTAGRQAFVAYVRQQP